MLTTWFIIVKKHVCVVDSEIRAHEGIEPVITLVMVEHAAAVESAITVLMNMSSDRHLFIDIVDLNVIPALIHALSFQLVTHSTSSIDL